MSPYLGTAVKQAAPIRSTPDRMLLRGGRCLAAAPRVRYAAGMGFATTLLSTAAAVVPGLMQASALRQQSRALNQTASLQRNLDEQQARAMTSVALENQIRASRNAQMELASARSDAAASNLASEGSVVVREQDLATRLQDSITNAANEELQQVNTLRLQSTYNYINTRNSAARASYGAYSSLVGGVASGVSTFVKASMQP